MVKREIFNDPSEVVANADGVHVEGPDGVDVTMTPEAALETATRIGDAAVSALVARTKGHDEKNVSKTG